jgi:hypothetical protein
MTNYIAQSCPITSFKESEGNHCQTLDDTLPIWLCQQLGDTAFLDSQIIDNLGYHALLLVG